MIHYEITNAFKHAHAGLRLLHVANSFCEKALQALSYYLEDGVSQERIELVDGRTVIGESTSNLSPFYHELFLLIFLLFKAHI